MIPAHTSVERKYTPTVERRQLREESRRLLTKEASETSNSGEAGDLSPEYFEECHEVTEEGPELLVGVPDSDTRDDNDLVKEFWI